MDAKALQVIQRVTILEKLLSADLGEQFISIISDFIENSLDEYENEYLNIALGEFKKENRTAAMEVLDSVKKNFVEKIFSSPCHQDWSSLVPTSDKDTKFCVECKRNVFRVYNKDDYRKRKHLNQCVAISYSQFEKVNDGIGCEISLTQQYELLGQPAPFKL